MIKNNSLTLDYTQLNTNRIDKSKNFSKNYTILI